MLFYINVINFLNGLIINLKKINIMDLVKLITDKVKDVETSGKLEEIIEKNVLKCREDIVKDFFQRSGEVKKSIEEALKDNLHINSENLNLDRY